jgi:V/A-type H+/Na+-transporting ATPase subunit D
MAKIKLTKGELKRQRDALKQYQRYLPTLQLKKQQLQMEILRQVAARDARKRDEASKTREAEAWAGLLTDKTIDIKQWVVAAKVIASNKNVAGVDVPVFERCEFETAEYDLYIVPLWVDAATDALRAIAALREELKTIEDGITILRQELRVTTQRVNLFEKVKIPEAEEAIRRIKIYIGDQMANAVGRSKIAKKKIEAAVLEEVAA